MIWNTLDRPVWCGVDCYAVDCFLHEAECFLHAIVNRPHEIERTIVCIPETSDTIVGDLVRESEVTVKPVGEIRLRPPVHRGVRLPSSKQVPVSNPA